MGDTPSRRDRNIESDWLSAQNAPKDDVATEIHRLTKENAELRVRLADMTAEANQLAIERDVALRDWRTARARESSR